jgi:hypothetical protein
MTSPATTPWALVAERLLAPRREVARAPALIDAGACEMISVRIALQNGEIQNAMHDMRLWLDERGLEPSTFRFREDTADLTFKKVSDAKDFADQFGGRLIVGCDEAI